MCEHPKGSGSVSLNSTAVAVLYQSRPYFRKRKNLPPSAVILHCHYASLEAVRNISCNQGSDIFGSLVAHCSCQKILRHGNEIISPRPPSGDSPAVCDAPKSGTLPISPSMSGHFWPIAVTRGRGVTVLGPP